MRCSFVVLLLLGALYAVNSSDLGSSAVPPGKPITGAAGVYGWGNSVWREEYEPVGAEHMKNPITGKPLTGPGGYQGLDGPPYNPTPMTSSWKSQWKVNHWDSLLWRYGMLVVVGRADGGEVTMTRAGGAQYGRWESKMVIKFARKSTSNKYRALFELVPVTSSQYHCGAQTITYADHITGTQRASLKINTLPKHSYQHSVSLSTKTMNHYHTFAVEVAKTHIAWFVDDRVVMYEKRKAALRHPRLTLRIRFLGEPGQKFPVPADETPALQFDWNRFFDLHRRNKHPVNRAPKCSRLTTNPAAC